MTLIILATCSRSFSEWSAARELLATVHTLHPDALLRHGDCERGDRQIAGIWRDLGGKDDPVPADWVHCAVELTEEQAVANRQAGIGPCQTSHRRLSRRHGEYCPTAGLRRDVLMEQARALLAAVQTDREWSAVVQAVLDVCGANLRLAPAAEGSVSVLPEETPGGTP